MKFVSTILGAVSMIAAMASAPAHAAPQILAVMASLGPQPMSCSGSTCTTSFSSYCLQRERDVPTTGQLYMPAHPDQFSLVITKADGTEVSVPAGDHVKFRSARGYSAVNVVMGRADFEALGAASAKIVVARGAALVPAPVEGDPNPISEAEMAFATKSLREHGEDVVDAQPDAQAAAVINRIAATIVPKAKIGTDTLEQLWRDVIDGLGPARPANADAIKRARDIYDWCQNRSSYHTLSGIKSCLEFKHDEGIMRLNTDYWESQPGY